MGSADVLALFSIDTPFTAQGMNRDDLRPKRTCGSSGYNGGRSFISSLSLGAVQ